MTFIQTLKVVIEYSLVVILISITRGVIHNLLDITLPLITARYSKFCVIASSYRRNFKAVDLMVLAFAIDLIVICKMKFVGLDRLEQFFVRTSYMSGISKTLNITIGFIFAFILTFHFLASVFLIIKSRDLLFTEVRHKGVLFMMPIRNLSDADYYNRVRNTNLRNLRRKHDLFSAISLVFTLFVYFGQIG